MNTLNLCNNEPSPVDKGSVLSIPLNNDDWALGQVIYPGINFYLGVVLNNFGSSPRAADIEGKELRLFSWTNDAEIFRGNWKLLGKIDHIQEMVLPEYKVYVDGNAVVESFDGQSTRTFNDASDAQLSFRKVRSPLIVQDAVQAALGYGKWKPAFEEMLR